MTSKPITKAAKSASNGNRVQRAQVLVEGAYFTYDEMAAKTGRTKVQCQHRYAHLKRKGTWPITWEMLA